MLNKTKETIVETFEFPESILIIVTKPTNKKGN